MKHLVSQCDYEQTITLDRLLRDVFVAGLRSGPVMSTVMQSADTLSFNDAIDKAKMVHQIRQDAAKLKSSTTLRVHASTEEFDEDAISFHRLHQRSTLQQKSVPSTYVCTRCGAKARHFVDKCFAIKLDCRKCNKTGHIAAVCRSNKSSGKIYSLEDSAANVNAYMLMLYLHSLVYLVMMAV